MTPTPGVLERSGRAWLLALAAGAVVCALLMASGPALIACTRNTPAELLLLLGRAHALHVALLWGGGAVAVLVFSVLLHTTGAFLAGKRAGRRAFAAEVLWTLVPVLIVIGMAIPAIRAYAVSAEPPSRAEALAPGYRCQLGAGQRQA